MDIAQTRYFLSVAETLNYTQAALTNNISRQAMRQSLKALELEIGAPLISNTHNHLALTDAGTAFVAAMKPALAAFDRAEAQVKEFVAGQNNISLAYSSSMFPFIFPSLLEMAGSFCARHDGIHIANIAMAAADVPHAISKGQTDCGLFLSVPPHTYEHIAVYEIASFELGVTLSASHPLAGKSRLELKDLEGLDLVGFDNPAISMKPVFEEAQKQGIPLSCTIVPDVISALQSAKESAAFLDVRVESAPILGIGVATVPLEHYKFCLCFGIHDAACGIPAISMLKDHCARHYAEVSKLAH